MECCLSYDASKKWKSNVLAALFAHGALVNEKVLGHLNHYTENNVPQCILAFSEQQATLLNSNQASKDNTQTLLSDIHEVFNSCDMLSTNIINLYDDYSGVV